MKQTFLIAILAAIFAGLASLELYSGLPQGVVFAILLATVLCSLYAIVCRVAGGDSRAEELARRSLLGFAALVSLVIQALLGMFYFARFQWSIVPVGMITLWIAPTLLIVVASLASLRDRSRGPGITMTLLVLAVVAQLILATTARY